MDPFLIEKIQFGEEIYPNTRQHYPSKKNKTTTYNYWKQLTQQLPSK